MPATLPPPEGDTTIKQLQARLSASEAENVRLREMLHRTGMFTKEQLGGVVGRKPAKVTKPSDHIRISMARANAVLDLAVLFQGEDAKYNAVWITKAAIERDQSVREAMPQHATKKSKDNKPKKQPQSWLHSNLSDSFYEVAFNLLFECGKEPVWAESAV
jgi:hypothetical protein